MAGRASGRGGACVGQARSAPAPRRGAREEGRRASTWREGRPARRAAGAPRPPGGHRRAPVGVGREPRPWAADLERAWDEGVAAIMALHQERTALNQRRKATGATLPPIGSIRRSRARSTTRPPEIASNWRTTAPTRISATASGPSSMRTMRWLPSRTSALPTCPSRSLRAASRRRSSGVSSMRPLFSGATRRTRTTRRRCLGTSRSTPTGEWPPFHAPAAGGEE